MKTAKEIMKEFETRYPASVLIDNPFICCDATGFLKAISTLYPDLSRECDDRILALNITGTIALVRELGKDN